MYRNITYPDHFSEPLLNKCVPSEVNQGLSSAASLISGSGIQDIAKEIGQCPKLKTLRLEENCLSLDKIPTSLFTDRWVFDVE